MSAIQRRRFSLISILLGAVACAGSDIPMPLEPTSALASVKAPPADTVGYEMIDLGGSPDGGSFFPLGITDGGEVLIRTTERGRPDAFYITHRGALRKLPDADGRPMTVTDMNGRGQVTGNFRSSPDPWVYGLSAFFWRGHGQLLDLGQTFYEEFYGYTQTINDAGHVAFLQQVIGPTGNAEFHPFVSHGNSTTDLGCPPGSTLCYPTDINNSGDVAGASLLDATSEYRSFLWRGNDRIQIPSLAPGFSRPTAVNASGQVVGLSTAPDNHLHVYFWDGNVTMDIGRATDGAYTKVFLNNAGMVASNHTDITFSNDQAFVWTAAGGNVDIGTLGGTESRIQGINNAGQAVGWSYVTSGSYQTEAFVWQNGTMTALGTLGGPYSEAKAINRDGIIVGMSWTANNEMRLVLWRPRSLPR